MCIAVELSGRPTIRVVSRLYSERTKPCPIANEKALTSWSNRSNEFQRPPRFDDSKWRASGTQLAAKTEHPECKFRNTMNVVNLRFVNLLKNVTRSGVGRLRMLYKANILLFV